MYVIIAGCGKVGSGLANKLSGEGHDVVIIDWDEESLKKLSPDFAGLRIVGVPFDQDVLKKAGIDKADAVAAVTPEDNVNIMVSQIAKHLYGIKRVLARIYNPRREYVFHQFGLDTFCPTNVSVEIMTDILLGQTTETSCTIGSNTLSFSLKEPGRGQVGRKVKDINRDMDDFIFGLLKKSEFTFAYGDSVIEEGDVLVLSRKLD